MRKAIVSVIIPAYQAERSISRTLASVQASTLREIDICVVDDGSKDETALVLDDFIRKDTRIRVIHQRNKGAYLARLCALRRIATPYFAFVDADDRVVPTIYQEMVDFAEKNKLDIVKCETVGVHDGENIIYKSKEEVYASYVYPWLVQGVGAAFVWDKLYRNRFNFSQFAEVPILMFEDMVFNLQFFFEVGRFGILSRGLYYYDVNDGSSVRNYRPKNLKDFEATIAFRRQFIPKYGFTLSTEVDAWTLLNARNVFITAASAPANSLRVRWGNLREIVSSAEIHNALMRIRTQRKLSHKELFVACACRFPCLIGCLLGVLKRVQRILRK